MLLVREEHASHSRDDASEAKEGDDEFVKSVGAVLSSTKSGSSKALLYRTAPKFYGVINDCSD